MKYCQISLRLWHSDERLVLVSCIRKVACQKSSLMSYIRAPWNAYLNLIKKIIFFKRRNKLLGNASCHFLTQSFSLPSTTLCCPCSLSLTPPLSTAGTSTVSGTLGPAQMCLFPHEEWHHSHKGAVSVWVFTVFIVTSRIFVGPATICLYCIAMLYFSPCSRAVSMRKSMSLL